MGVAQDVCILWPRFNWYLSQVYLHKQIWLTMVSIQRSLSLHISNVPRQSRTNSGLKGLPNYALEAQNIIVCYPIQPEVTKTLKIYFLEKGALTGPVFPPS